MLKSTLVLKLKYVKQPDLEKKLLMQSSAEQLHFHKNIPKIIPNLIF
jgi:hypothetical protein